MGESTFLSVCFFTHFECNICVAVCFLSWPRSFGPDQFRSRILTKLIDILKTLRLMIGNRIVKLSSGSSRRIDS
jgi:hypothetical protein